LVQQNTDNRIAEKNNWIILLNEDIVSLTSINDGYKEE
jgi:hypothetical protein